MRLLDRYEEIVGHQEVERLRRLAERLAQVRRSGELPGLRPDGKTQVTIEYDGDRPVRVAARGTPYQPPTESGARGSPRRTRR